MKHLRRHTKRTFIAIAGGLVVLIGIVMIPYPGPGWLVVFAGLAILATEFAFAARVLEKLRAFYERWKGWLKRQSRVVQVCSLVCTGLVVVATIWMLNGFGFSAAVLGLEWDWLTSPFFR